MYLKDGQAGNPAEFSGDYAYGARLANLKNGKTEFQKMHLRAGAVWTAPQSVKSSRCCFFAAVRGVFARDSCGFSGLICSMPMGAYAQIGANFSAYRRGGEGYSTAY
ncbi:hypothetical protein [Paraburkholderia tropica]|uniref:hypothetical protein n=2 Tax=Paraburkholderia tropica TaxID=92647 RepID=UPI0012EAF317|nr:hypothetical protein [Paraburkholderia tropica]MBB2984610.1 hypothetical protein [Paraburkholderia tropica]